MLAKLFQGAPLINAMKVALLTVIPSSSPEASDANTNETTTHETLVRNIRDFIDTRGISTVPFRPQSDESSIPQTPSKKRAHPHKEEKKDLAENSALLTTKNPNSSRVKRAKTYEEDELDRENLRDESTNDMVVLLKLINEGKIHPDRRPPVLETPPLLSPLYQYTTLASYLAPVCPEPTPNQQH